MDQLDQVADFSRLGKDEVFKRRTLSPRRFKGLGAFFGSWAMYSYAPYIALYTGTTFPVLGAVFAGLYGMLQFSESQIVNSIKIVREAENYGKLLITVGESAFSSSEIIVDVKDIQSIVALGNDDFGEDGQDGNVLSVSRYFCKSSGKWIDSGRALTLPGDAFRDRHFLDWVLAEKSGESDLLADFQDLMLKQHDQAVQSGKIGGLDLLATRDQVHLPQQTDFFIEAQLKEDDETV